MPILTIPSYGLTQISAPEPIITPMRTQLQPECQVPLCQASCWLGRSGPGPNRTQLLSASGDLCFKTTTLVPPPVVVFVSHDIASTHVKSWKTKRGIGSTVRIRTLVCPDTAPSLGSLSSWSSYSSYWSYSMPSIYFVNQNSTSPNLY